MTHAATLNQPATTVPFFSQADSLRAVWPLVVSGLDELIGRGRYSHGPLVAQLQQELAAWTGARHVVGVNSGTDALVLLLRAAGLRPGEDVVVPAFSFVASASSVVLAGGRPVFADIEPAGYGLDPAAADLAVTPRTRMIMPAHLFCQLADLAGIGAVARRHGLTVIEDSAEAIGMRWDGTHAGLVGAGGVLSFFPSKTLGALGDAGAVLTNDPRIAETAAALSCHGRFGRTIDDAPSIAQESVLPGLNSKMDDLQAAVLLAKLTRLDSDIASRARLAAAYTERLTGTPGVLRLPVPVPRSVPTEPVFYVYQVEVAARDELAGWLARHGVRTETFYPVPLHLQPCFAHLGHRPGDFPRAEAACARTLALPLYPDLRLDALERVCELIRAFYRSEG